MHSMNYQYPVGRAGLEPSPRPINPCVLRLCQKTTSRKHASSVNVYQRQSISGIVVSPESRYSPDNLPKNVISWWRLPDEWGVIQSIFTAAEKQLRSSLSWWEPQPVLAATRFSLSPAYCPSKSSSNGRFTCIGLLRKLGCIPEEGTSLRDETSCSKNICRNFHEL